ncbi:winged helix-turn-helix domain-containing protein [Sphingomonas bacterium]|uniref:ArsR/SmtB family transcription factor n=1 Tax=Sphingomonas bacterium TaxID=1895847 RepID=UPI002606FC80|nr:winged helix-turn-helix domain-containing protein [Sphingomonas bacterium]MDB5677893.1 helix-turn-helix domain protein [Sphingomonas bacterium]
MKDGPNIAAIAALIGDPARANMLTALMDGRALTVSELAEAGGVALPTASGHLARLEQSGLLAAEKQGRHRYLRLSGGDVADTLEALMGLAQRTGAVRVRTGPRDAALREARVCYDHLAGERAVMLASSLAARGLMADDALTDAGRAWFATRDFVKGDGLRPFCRTCLDWSERRHHLGGVLGAAILTRAIDQGWAARGEGRVVRFSPMGIIAFDALFGLN